MHGIGRRLCLGKSMALLEIKLLAVTLLQNFQFKLQPNFDDEITPSIILKVIPQRFLLSSWCDVMM
jgi:cytochrome P450